MFVRYAPTQKDINVLSPFQRKCLLPWILHFLIDSLFHTSFSRENQNKDSVFYDFFQTEDLQSDPSLTLIIHPENPSFIIPSESRSSVLDTENTGLPTMSSHDVHDPITPNIGETRKKTATLVPFDIVYSR